jgi:NAD(P)-dependent dehydrogenase (short-subunit alcohol dehydrogenase family)
VAADVSREVDVQALIAEIRESMPPIRGVVHAAGVLKDSLLDTTTWEAVEKLLAPKVAGGWNLHCALRDVELDFFALCSSAASVIGGPGQGGYAAANAFLDALAYYRRSLGLHAVSFNWGPWAEVGMIVKLQEQERAALHSLKGLGVIRPKQGSDIFELGVARNDAQLIIMPLDWKRRANREVSGDEPIVSPFGRESLQQAERGPETEVLRAIHKAKTPGEAQGIVEGFLANEISSVLKIPRERVDHHTGIDRLGLDSLMAMELKVRVESTLPLTVPVVKLLQGLTLVELSASLCAELAAASPRVASPAATAVAAEVKPEDVDRMTEADVDRMLASLAGQPGKPDVRS